MLPKAPLAAVQAAATFLPGPMASAAAPSEEARAGISLPPPTTPRAIPALEYNSSGEYTWKVLPDKIYLIDGVLSDVKFNVLSDRISFSGIYKLSNLSDCRIFFCLTEPFLAPIDGIYSGSVCTITSRNVDDPNWYGRLSSPLLFSITLLRLQHPHSPHKMSFSHTAQKVPFPV